MQLGETFDLARVYGAGEAIKAGRLNNQMRQQDLTAQTIFQDTAKAAVDPTSGQYSPAKHAQALTAAGYPQAGQQLLTQQVETADKFLSYATRVAPFMNEQSYPKIKQQLEAGGVPPGVLPEQFDPVAINNLVTRMKGNRDDAYGALQTLGTNADGTPLRGQVNAKDGKIAYAPNVKPDRAPSAKMVAVPNGDGTVTYRNSQGLEGTTARTNPSAGGEGKPFKFTASDTNAIYRQSVGLFGGLYDPTTQQITGLDPQQMPRVQAIAAEASRIYREGGGEIDHASAVEQALASSGAKKSPGQPKPQPQTPAGPPLNLLKPGKTTVFANGQKWTLGANGQAQQVQ